MKRSRPAPIETELKLLLPRAAARRIASHPLLKVPGGASRRRLYSIYYDTPALELRRQGIALRVRREGRRWVQTVKGGGVVRGGLHQRAEDEAKVPGPKPDPGRIADPALAAVFTSARLRARLAPVFTTDFTRHKRVVERHGARIEASIDQGRIQAGRRSAPISELELELKEGAPRHLYAFAQELAAHLPLGISDRSKAERGYLLVDARLEAPAKARAATLDRRMSLSEAFSAVMWANLAHLHANQPGMLESREPEYLHQMRVAVRRLRSAVALFAPFFAEADIAPVRAGLKSLAAALGAARDWDVFVRETLPPIEAEFGRRKGLQAFAARCAKLRASAAARARRAVRSARFRQFELRLAAWLAGEDWLGRSGAAAGLAWRGRVTGFSSAVLARRYSQVRRRGRGLDALTSAELHRLRIAVKKFRYALDFFSSLYERRVARAALKRLGRLQDILGAMNDAATAAALIERGFAGASGRAVSEAKGLLLGWSRGRAATLRGELRGAWKEFRAIEKFW